MSSSMDIDDPPEKFPADASDGAMQEPQDFNGPDPIGEEIIPQRRTEIPRDAAPKALARPTYFSLGDNGTTATVNAYGRILQISRFSEYARSGFFCADLPSMAEPYYVKRRMENILDLIDEPAAGIGIDWDHTFKATGDAIRDKPTMEFIDDRWPLFAFDPSNTFKQSHHGKQPQDQLPPTDSQHTTRSGHRVFSGISIKSRLSTQYLCSDGTIFQRYVLAREMQDPTADASIPTQLKLATDLLIRDMDFTEKTTFNDTNRGPDYTFQCGSDKQSIRVTHTIPGERRSMGTQLDRMTNSWPTAVELVIQPFAIVTHQENRNPDVTALEVSESGSTWYIHLSQRVRDEFESSKILDISIAYTLNVQGDAKRSEPERNPTSNSNQMSAAFSALKNIKFERLTFSSHAHLDFTIRRNLEHILSVCSIPVIQPERETAAVALTCGDVSGHRVALSASFFAFQFLLCAERHLGAEKSDSCSCNGAELSTCESYSCRLRHRVQMTGSGHLKWGFGNTQTSNDRFSLHYWATGKEIEDKIGLPLPSPADTALQVLKIFDPSRDRELHDKWREGLPESVEKTIRDRVQAWAHDLEREDKRKKYAFARHTIDNQEKFRLSDHVRIYSAFRLIERFRDDHTSRTNPLSLDGPDAFVSKNFNPDDVKKNILKRFTTEDPLSKQHILATTRTASETRFLFHSKDTALFYAMDDGVFTKNQVRTDEDDGGDKQDIVWTKAVSCQAEHEEAQCIARRKPLWLATMAIAGSKGQTINTLEPLHAMRVATEALLSSSSPNGLFPGLLDADQEPTCFDKGHRRDDYWHSTFEIPYALWRYGNDGIQNEERSSKHARARSATDMQTSNRKVRPSGILRHKTTKFVNLDKLIDRKGLVEITDDWLQKGPKALDFTFEPRFLVTSSDGSVQQIDVGENLRRFDIKIFRALTYIKKYRSILPSPDKSVKGVIVDVPRGHDNKKDEGISRSLVTYDELAKTLGKTRTVNAAKKKDHLGTL